MLYATIIVATTFFFILMGGSLVTSASSISPLSIPDLSEWQGSLTASEVKKLKSEVPFVILRVQYGSGYKDLDFSHNAALCKKYGLKYGVYSYSLYTSPSDAKVEAKDLYERGINASFYVNDYEQQTVTSGTTNTATVDWYKELHKLAPHKRILFYSYNSFAQEYASKAMKDYDGYWLADYTSVQPTGIDYYLWQYTDNWYTSALGQYVDASKEHLKNTSWFLSSRPISYKKVVYPSKNGYDIWNNLMFTSHGGVTITGKHQYYEARYYYNHYNGRKYYSIYKNNKWIGYVNAKSMTTLKSGLMSQTIKIIKKNQIIWGNLFFTQKLANTSNYYNDLFSVKYYYNHPNGSVYYSLYNGNKWVGYVNKNNVTVK